MLAQDLAAVLLKNPDSRVYFVTLSPDGGIETSEPAVDYGHALLHGRTILISDQKTRDVRFPTYKKVL